MGPRTGVHGCGKSPLPLDLVPEPSSLLQVAVPSTNIPTDLEPDVSTMPK